MSNKLVTMPGTLFIISAPSGGGKTSLIKALIAQTTDLEVAISYTTRKKRPGEQDGVNYHFVDVPTFEELIKQQAFLEYAQVFGNYYGTSQQTVTEKLQTGTDIILEIDWQGAQQVRALLPASIGIFILPPSSQVLAQRLQQRAQDDAAVIARRLAEARTEISHYSEYEYLVVNEDFNQATADLKAIILAQRLRQAAQKVRYTELLHNLL